MPHSQERQFGSLFAFVFAVVAFWPLWPLAAPNPYWLAGAAAWIGAALACPRALSPLYRGWMVLGHALGWINARLILGLVFFLIVTPTGLVLRLLGKDVLNLGRRRAGTTWVERDQAPTPDSMRNQF